VGRVLAHADSVSTAAIIDATTLSDGFIGERPRSRAAESSSEIRRCGSRLQADGYTAAPASKTILPRGII
jgi:hypothetical protein